MDRIIYTYALIKTLYDVEEDYVDCFLPFVIKSFSNEEKLNKNLIQKKIKENSKLEMPIHVINTILYRAQQRKLVTKDRKNYSITKEGLEYLDKSETEKDVNRRIRALIDDMKEFFVKNGHNLSYDEVQNLICSFISKNLKTLIEFINPTNSLDIKIQKIEGFETFLVEYIEEVEKKKPNHYNTLRDMILGSLISVIIYSKKPSQVDKIRNNWAHCQIFFDTNFIFSLLGLHTSNFNEPAQELFKLLKTNGFELKIFDFTVNEIANVMNSFPKDGKRYPKSVNINTLYKNLNDKNWTKSDVIEFLTNLEDTLNEKGIVIESTNIDLTNYKPVDKDAINKLEKYKDFQSSHGQAHDLAAIYSIKDIRGKSIRKFEDVSALFLSSDVQLSKYDLKERGHEAHKTIGEVILDRSLTSILWLKDPNADISLKAIIESHSQDLFIRRRVWDKFFNVLQELRQDDKINDENVSMFFYHGQVESLLKGLNDDEIEKITPEFVLRGIENAEKLKKKDVQEMEEKEKDFFDELKKEQKEHSEKLETIQMGLKRAADKEANKYAHLLAIPISSAILGFSLLILYYVYEFLKQSGDSYYIIIAIGFIGVFLTVSGIPKHQEGIYSRIHNYFKNKLFESCYTKKMKEANLSE